MQRSDARRAQRVFTAQIVFEAAAALVLAIVGATVRSPPLREVTWRSEMKRRYVASSYHEISV